VRVDHLAPPGVAEEATILDSRDAPGCEPGHICEGAELHLGVTSI
jgi:hypothetical protein